ncbi:hypothetical protein AHF37_08618 [Paragonimus kellicotti]|nr:hypothetical protein AHF37_08618 [Paragonimus kellicotti]
MFTTNEKKKLLSIFEQLDTDKNGSISRTEMEKRITELKINKGYIKVGFVGVYPCADYEQGYITVTMPKHLEGYCLQTTEQILIESLQNPFFLAKIKWIQLFQEIDVDNSGRLSVDEVHAIFAGDEFTEPVDVVKSWIAQFDEDKDGQLNETEFLEFVCQKVSKKK